MHLKLTTALSLIALSTGAAQSETRELDAHQHGHGALNIAVEGGVMAMELEVPGADIVGFEHPAESAEDRAAIDAAIAKLAKPLELFVIPSDAGCTVTAANVELIGDEDEHGHDDHDHDKHDHDDDHAEHDDEHKHDEDHAEHKDEHDHAEHKDEHAHDDDHAEHADKHDHGDEHADEHGGESHTEFHAEYALACADPSAIDAIDFAYFGLFPNAQELDIQMISDKGAKGFEVERDDPRLSLSGAI